VAEDAGAHLLPHIRSAAGPVRVAGTEVAGNGELVVELRFDPGSLGDDRPHAMLRELAYAVIGRSRSRARSWRNGRSGTARSSSW
jgi:hypothetical protein